jgi:hypothetical protein
MREPVHELMHILQACMHTCDTNELTCHVCVWVCVCVCVRVCRCTFQDNGECGICAQNEAVVYVHNRLGKDVDQVTRKARMEKYMPKSESEKKLLQTSGEADSNSSMRDGDGTNANAQAHGDQKQQRGDDYTQARPHSAQQPRMELEDLMSEGEGGSKQRGEGRGRGKAPAAAAGNVGDGQHENAGMSLSPAAVAQLEYACASVSAYPLRGIRYIMHTHRFLQVSPKYFHWTVEDERCTPARDLYNVESSL